MIITNRYAINFVNISPNIPPSLMDNKVYGALVELPEMSSTAKKIAINEKVVSISRDFLEAMSTLGRIIISERYVEVGAVTGRRRITQQGGQEDHKADRFGGSARR
jgi:hypothetical protein